MEPINPKDAAPQTPLAPREGGTTAPRSRRQRMWLGLVTGTAMMVAVGMTTPQPAAAACWYDPRCLVDAILDPIFDTVKGVLKLTWNVITLDPEDAWEDLKEVGYNQICGPGLSVFTMAVANGLEEDFDECASPPHSIEQDVLEKLQLYIKSPLDTVHIHEGCNLNADVIPGDDSSHRDAITFGEHIYFEPGEYHPQDDYGFALLAHELTHVLQYRQKGFADFTCQYATHCAFGLYQGCEIEESAYDYQDLVLQDRQADSDGVFPPTDNCPDDPNPYQADANGDGIGDACDPNQNLVDRSGEYGTPPVASPPTAVVLPGLGVSNIAYRDTSGQLHELWRDAQGTTGTTNLTANAGAPPAVGTPFAYVDTNHNTEILLYRDDAGTVRSLYWSTGAVGHDNLGDTAGAPKAAGDPVGYYAPTADTHTVVYRTSDGHLHSLYWVGVAPVAYGGNLTWTIDAPPAAGDPTALDAAGVNLVIYRSVQGEILSVYWTDGPSGLDNLSGVAGTPPAAGDPVAYYTAHDDTTQVAYLDTDGHLWELYWVGVAPVVGWDLTAQAGAPQATGTPAAYYSAGTHTKHVIYRDADGGLHEIWWVPGGGTPAHVDLSAAYGAPPAAGDPVAFTVEGPNTQHVVYRGTDKHIYEMRW